MDTQYVANRSRLNSSIPRAAETHSICRPESAQILGAHLRGGAWIVPQRLRRDGAGGVGGVSHGMLLKSKKSSRLGCAASLAVKWAELADETVLNKLDHGGVIHWDVRDIVTAREWRDDDVGQTETELRGEALLSRGIIRIGAGVNRSQIAMHGRCSAGSARRGYSHRDSRDSGNIRNRAEIRIGVVV